MTLAIGIIVIFISGCFITRRQWPGQRRMTYGDRVIFKNKGGRLTVAFAAILAAFALILTGLKMQGDGVCLLGFILLVAAMLYSPFKVYVLDRKK